MDNKEKEMQSFLSAFFQLRHYWVGAFLCTFLNAAAALQGKPLCCTSTWICRAADKVFLIWLGDLRTLGCVTGSAAKVSYERIMRY